MSNIYNLEPPTKGKVGWFSSMGTSFDHGFGPNSSTHAGGPPHHHGGLGH